MPGLSSTQHIQRLELTTKISAVVKNRVCPADTTVPAVISVLTAPMIDLTVLGDSICPGQTASVTIENREPGVSYSLINAGVPVNATPDSSSKGKYILTTVKTITGSTLFKIVAANGTACKDTLSGTARVTVVKPNPQLSGTFNQVCPGSEEVYTLTKESGHVYSINVTGDSILNDSNMTNIQITWKTNVSKGFIILSDTIKGYSCGIVDTFIVPLIDSIPPEIICAKDIYVSKNLADIQQNIYQYPAVSYELQPTVTEKCGYIIKNNFNDSSSIRTGTLIPINVAGSGNNFADTILWTVVNMGQKVATCKISINVTIEDQLQPVSAFSPNGDGHNDTWTIKNIERYPDATIEVFNRWGELVFESKSDYYSNNWDGSNLPVDSYHYVITQNDKLLSRGVVTIIR